MKGPIRPTSKRRLPGRAPYVVTALRRKYAEVLGLGDKVAAGHVGAVLLLFSPEEDLSAIKAVRPYKAERQRWMDTAFRVLRKEGRPMSGRELAYRVMEAHHLDPQDFPRLKSIECGLHAVLARLEGDGVTRLPGRPKRWKLTPQP